MAHSAKSRNSLGRIDSPKGWTPSLVSSRENSAVREAQPPGGGIIELEHRSRLQVWSRVAALIGIMCLLSDFAPARSQARNHPDASDLGATARQATIAIFRDRDSTAIDRFFSEPFVQHDPNIGDGLPGLRAFVTELANSPTTNITIYRTVVDGDIVMLHSNCEGCPGFSGPVIAFDLFRFKDGKIVEHWGGQTPAAGAIPGQHTQLDGATAVVFRERTEA